MKIILSITALILISIIAVAAMNKKEFISLKFDNTKICVPKEYIPGLSLFGQWLQDNVSGLDELAQSETIRLPAKLIMSGVVGYKFSHINEYNVDREHEINGIAYNLSSVGKPFADTPCNDEFDLSYCYQSVVYKDIFYQYALQKVELENKEKVNEYLYVLFKGWEQNCGTE